MSTVDDAREALAELEGMLRDRQPDIRKRTKYYRGEHPLRFSSPQFRGWFATQFEGFADNWVAPVADATSERIQVVGVRPADDKQVDGELSDIWERNGGPTESALAFNTAAVTSRSFGLVWAEENEAGVVNPVLTFEHPSQAVVKHVPGSRRERESALKLWGDGEFDYANVFLPDALYKFKRHAVSQGTFVTEFAGDKDWVPRRDDGDDGYPLDNPFGVVPVVELPNRPQLSGEPLSEIEEAIPIQDAVNLLWSYLFTAADFAALPQRVIMGAQFPQLPILDADGEVTGWRTIEVDEANIKRILNIEGPEASIGQWDAADLSKFTEVIERAVSHIANQTRTPLYYFASSIQNISGDTLKALETGLVEKISNRKLFFSDPLRELFRLLALAVGDEDKADRVSRGEIVYTNHESRSIEQMVDALSKLGKLGFPFRYLAEQYVGGDADELERIMAMREEELRNEPMQLLARQEQMMMGVDNEPGNSNSQNPPA